jgi:hypothetical protein
MGAIRTPRSATLLGVSDTIVAHPWMIVVGLLAGSWLASKYSPSWGEIWGEHHASHAREKSLHGRKGRKR